MVATTAIAQGTPSLSISRCAYHVFLSFRGEDTRHKFTDHLYTALMQAGIHTFKDDNGIERGEDIEAELQTAIQKSKISIVMLSKNYASSQWCLDELVTIMERRRSSTSEHFVIPVFHYVDPSEVRKQKRNFADAFAKHEECFKEDMEKVKRWRAALREVADLGGMVLLQNRSESQFIQKIVEQVQRKLNRVVLNVPSYIVGTDHIVNKINSWLRDGANDVALAGITGIGGIGKTTIATIIYNQNFGRFQASSFLANIRENSAEPEGLIHLQSQFLSDLLKGQKIYVPNVYEGLSKIKDVLCCRKVLVVLDDIDDKDQVNAIIGMSEWCYPGSKIIITTRYEHLLQFDEIYKEFRVGELQDNEALQLLSWHAFGQDNPIESYNECSRNIMKHCHGLPLALKVLGSSLRGKRMDVWKSQLRKLEVVPNDKIQKVLRISYDSLQDDLDKNLFLDIACFFVGKNKDYVATILENCGFITTVGIENLIDRNLLSVDASNKLRMHQLIKEMGKEIVREESPKNPGKRSRLWHDEDAFNVLKEKMGTENIESLTLDLHRLKEINHGKTVTTVNCKKRYRDEDSTLVQDMNSTKRCCFSLFTWKPMNKTTRSSFPALHELDLETDAFRNMNRLKLLQLNYVKFIGGYEKFPKGLVWLCWHGFPLESLPEEFYLKKLAVLDIRNGKLNRDWKRGKPLEKLKILNLSHCQKLVRSPDLEGLPNLEKLKLKYCTNLIEIDDSIKYLKGLLFLNLKGCKNLQKLSSKIGMLTSLEVVILNGCSRLEKLPSNLDKMESLKVLLADGTAINRSIYSSQSWLSTIKPSWLFPKRIPRSPSFPWVSLPRSLVRLSLANCNLSDDAIPNDLSCLSCLQDLNLAGNPIRRLPESISNINTLVSLYLKRCTKLQFLPELPLSLKMLDVSWCTSLKRIVNLPKSSMDSRIDLFGCTKLIEIQDSFKLEPVTETDIDLIMKLALFNPETIHSIEVDMYSILTLKTRKAPVQVLHEHGISSIFLEGKEVPSWYNHLNTGSSVSFDLCPLIGQKFSGLNICIVYGRKNTLDRQFPNYWELRVETKSAKWCYGPSSCGIPRLNENMLWLSHWKFGDKLKAGDQVTVSVEMSPFEATKCGIHLLYESDNKGTEKMAQNTCYWHRALNFKHRGLCNMKEKWEAGLGEESYIYYSGIHVALFVACLTGGYKAIGI
ncbi:TMV resistance protein N-like [Carica papaya]|uniref:TMV resistance protein N-like n=1 Tax=Carica papaya TaxID=3649 RepID=UPI000B8CD767|nr:TMV resistance protein N-like [Carica papaya]